MSEFAPRVLAETSLTGDDAKAFHLLISVSEPENPKSIYEETIEEWWISKDKWRREVTSKEGLHQTIVFVNGSKSEQDEGDYFPGWLRNFVTAVFDPAPGVDALYAAGATIDEKSYLNFGHSDPCARHQSRLGIGNHSVDITQSFCVDDRGRLKFYGNTNYGMGFDDYREFGGKQFPREFTDSPESGTKLVGRVVALEQESKAERPGLFTPLATNDDRFNSTVLSIEALQKLVADVPQIVWPTIRSGNTRGNLAIYVVIDSQGAVREAWPLPGDNGELHDLLINHARAWHLKPAVDATGKAIQVEGAVVFPFETTIDKPLPVISGADVQQYFLNCHYNPILPPGVIPSGKTVSLRMSVSETGEKSGISSRDLAAIPIFNKLGLNSTKCRFKPYLEDGKPTTYVMEITFTEP